jgi:hypothetical protein
MEGGYWKVSRIKDSKCTLEILKTGLAEDGFMAVVTVGRYNLFRSAIYDTEAKAMKAAKHFLTLLRSEVDGVLK